MAAVNYIVLIQVGQELSLSLLHYASTLCNTHCPKNNLYLRVKTVPVKAGGEATVYCKYGIYRHPFFVRRSRFFGGQCVYLSSDIKFKI